MLSNDLNSNHRVAFAAVADFLIPAYNKYPSASSVGVHTKMLDEVLGHRPDIIPAFLRGLAVIDVGNLSSTINVLYKDDPEGFSAISLAATSGYYMTETVRKVLGYPGQESVVYDAYEVPDFLINQNLENVVRRGPIYRPTPVE